MINRRPFALALTGLVAVGLSVTACTASPAEDDGRVQVLTSFYPLQFITEEIGGDLVTVTSLTPPGVEPHDLELSPASSRTIGEADLVVYLSDFQPAVDDAIAARQPAHVVDVAESAHLETPAEEHADEDHDEHATEDGHDHGTLDPHFWLDPTRLAAASASVVAELSTIDPANAAVYAERGADLVARLTALDTSFTDGLATCDSRVLVTSHEAFGYLAERYGLEQIGITGLDPEAEPSPARIKEVSALIRDEGVTTIYFETLASTKVTDTLAKDLSVATAVLDPLENLADPSKDYLSVMATNLESLRTGLGCR